MSGCVGLGVEFRACLDPKKPTFSGLLIMSSLHKSLKKVGFLGVRVGFRALGFRASGLGLRLGPTVGPFFPSCSLS